LAEAPFLEKMEHEFAPRKHRWRSEPDRFPGAPFTRRSAHQPVLAATGRRGPVAGVAISRHLSPIAYGLQHIEGSDRRRIDGAGDGSLRSKIALKPPAPRYAPLRRSQWQCSPAHRLEVVRLLPALNLVQLIARVLTCVVGDRAQPLERVPTNRRARGDSRIFKQDQSMPEDAVTASYFRRRQYAGLRLNGATATTTSERGVSRYTIENGKSLGKTLRVPCRYGRPIADMDTARATAVRTCAANLSPGPALMITLSDQALLPRNGPAQQAGNPAGAASRQ